MYVIVGRIFSVHVFHNLSYLTIWYSIQILFYHEVISNNFLLRNVWFDFRFAKHFTINISWGWWEIIYFNYFNLIIEQFCLWLLKGCKKRIYIRKLEIRNNPCLDMNEANMHYWIWSQISYILSANNSERKNVFYFHIVCLQ